MSYNLEQKLDKLKKFLTHKKGLLYCANRMGISYEEVKRLFDLLKDQNKSSVRTYEEDIKNGQATVSFNVETEIHNLEELITYGKIDTTKWKVVKYVQNYWGNRTNPHWQVKAWLEPLNSEDIFTEKFIEFLKEYKPKAQITKRKENVFTSKTCLILNKQDAHFNKLDIYGDNDINKRFEEVENALDIMITKAGLTSNVEQIYYIVGSDAFNSEWTGLTTKGTPQQNILSYEEAFEKICDHEVRCLTNLLEKAKRIKVIYVPGNHDENVGWHLIKWMKAFFRKETDLEFDTIQDYTKCERFYNSAIMFNHGDAMKSKELAQIFPMIFKDEWSKCNHFYIFTGDKHHDDTKSIKGIKFFQIASLSNAKSKWDSKNAHLDPAEMSGFVITDKKGMSDIYKEIL